MTDGHHHRFSASCAMRFLLRRALAQLHHDLVTLALVEAFLLADADHGAGIRPVGTPADRDLVGDRRAVDQPADGADIGPGQGSDS